ncbi:MAG: ribosome biogenesis GTPase Der [Verrucomicrobia bacterium RIFCSPHIGHO2_12_FULL_41_10]|nr:MAG: ribosome biogenesis GTPase Der [Verrucomicrobia bacterium RIFCSPHIGHO2_12_FULL_41_10]HLB34242.1 ribosome biogenesis GTPase Der [Chthoniobacterales bacterium]
MYRVAIVGRPNVGKSSLFNRLVGRRIAIVHDQPGVTRDRLASLCDKGRNPFELIDTGGIGDSPDPDFSEATHSAAMTAIASADLLLFLVDGRAGVTPLDRELAHQLRRTGHPLLLVVNKIDEKMHEPLVNDFYTLGFKNVLSMSAAHGCGLHDLMDAIDKNLEEAALLKKNSDQEKMSNELGTIDSNSEETLLVESGSEKDVVAPKLAIVGRPNVGKSSLLNKIIGEERSIVSSIPGTTRDVVDTLCLLKGVPYLLVDTAGLRHRSCPDTSVEIFSAMRSEEAIRRADVGVLVIDATAGVTAQDKRIAGMLQESTKPCIIVLNKWDLVHKEDGGRASQGEQAEVIRQELFFLEFAPVICLSAKTGQHIGRLLTSLEEVRRAAEVHIGTGELNRFFKAVWESQPPPSRGGRRFKLLYATQVVPEVQRPFYPPEFLLFVNDEKLMTDAYKKHILHTIREQWPFTGLPIRLRLQGRLSREEQDKKNIDQQRTAASNTVVKSEEERVKSPEA